ncbi:MAG: M36 family metallopeptidase [Burkholderiales bacterium]
MAIRQRKVLTSEVKAWRDDLETHGFRIVSVKEVKGEKEYSILKFAEQLPTSEQRKISKIKGISGVTGMAEISRSRDVPRRLYDLTTPKSNLPPRQIATRFLERATTLLGIPPKLEGLKFDQVKSTLFGSHALFQQYIGKLPISGAWIRVDIDKSGRVYNVQNDLVPIPALEKGAVKAKQITTKPMSKNTAFVFAIGDLPPKVRASATMLQSELVHRKFDDETREAWKIVARTTQPIGEWKFYVDAYSGEILWKRNVIKTANMGRVFDPNPVVALNDTALSTTAKIPAAAYRNVQLLGLSKTGFLDGQYVSTKITPARVRRTSGVFAFEQRDKGFKEVMVYFHIDRLQRHLQSLGFDNILSKTPIQVNVIGQKDDNSFYSPDKKLLSFGTGGVDDAEDAEVILHEYGHAIQDNQIPNWGESEEAGAMGEGFGDFLAGSFFAESKPLRLRSLIASWDARSYDTSDLPNLRRLDSAKHYPEDLRHEPHDDGEIWSACLWQLRSRLGRQVIERLVIAHHFLLNRWASFEDAANALLTTDQQLYAGKHAKDIRKIFKDRGILSR